MAADASPSQALQEVVAAYLAELAFANRSATTQRTYASDLAQLVSFHPGPIDSLSAEVLRGFFASFAQCKPATRARKQTVVGCLCAWAYRHDLIPANPMGKLERVRREAPKPRAVERAQIEAILASIPKHQERDRLLFRLLVETGLRISEALALHVDDLDLTVDDEHVRVEGKGGKRRTVLLDDPKLVGQLRSYLKRTGYQHGLLFRAQKNGDGRPLRYQSVQERWTGYCAKADVRCTLHQLRHSHATELVNAGVSLNTIRKRLGHQHIQTTLRYAEQNDVVADAEVRAWRRRKQRST